MDYKYKQLEQELSALSKRFGELSARLSEVAKAVANPGATPPEKLIEELAAARANFENVRAAVHGHAGNMLVSPLPKLAELMSIAGLDTLLKASAVAEEGKYSTDGEREKALAILSRVLAITHRESAEFKPLQDCHAAVVELRHSITQVVWPHRHPQSESVVAVKHPAASLLSFVENLDSLDDERWMALETSITGAYGKPLFVAASRGKLVTTPEASAPPVAEKKIAPVPAPPASKPGPVLAPTPAPVFVAPSPTVAPPPVVVAAAVSPAPAPAPAVQPAATTTNSLTALATATEPAPTADGDRQQREARPASPSTQVVVESEPTPSEEPGLTEEDQQQMVASEGSQRPQRWGFWRGNR